MSVRKGLTKTDYARHEEEAELDNIRPFLWGTEPPEIWTAPDTCTETYLYSAEPDREHSVVKKERKNQERSYTSALRTKQGSYSGRQFSQRNTRQNQSNYRGRR